MRTSLLYLAIGVLGCSAGGAGTQDQDADPNAIVDTTTDGGLKQEAPGHPSSNEDAAPPTTQGVVPAGWLYTQNGKIYVSNGSTGTQWVGRGVNADDIYLCGYNGSLWMSNPEAALTTMTSSLVQSWKPTFVRVSLGMDSYTQTSWSGTYKSQMTNVINALGANPNVYVLVTLRSDVSMPKWNNNDATGYPTASTDSVYRGLVDTFANSKFVLFGLSNEPGGSSLSNATIRAAMDHATSVIRAEEDKLGVPHHIVSAQGNGWTSDISFYAQTPLPYDNVVYEVHGYPPPASSYTYSSIPVIIGEYGSLTNSSAFFADIESKQIPSLAWDFDSYSDCTPDLLTITQSASNLVPSAWGNVVKAYLLAH
jgi:hypothetical protein